MLHYRRQGTGACLVLQHGFLGSGACFEPQMDFFSRAYDVVAADLPGFAGSAGCGYPGSVEGLAKALTATSPPSRRRLRPSWPPAMNIGA